ncbi:putative Longin-like domain-containing protein [Rosa chinensis]|uniref:Coatomer subunit zeta n=1 Tax=Rosa chinensis TaxID=74649 RepID=A0A2P6QGT7_ROSCH|nr:putative Longin-like domain-containing protein [Rosa chinensis]
MIGQQMLQSSHLKNLSAVIMFECNVVIYKFVQELHFFVTGGDNENELILATPLQGFFDAIALLLR